MATNLEAATQLIAHLEAEGVLGELDAALTQHVLTLAGQVDAEPGNDRISREYRLQLKELNYRLPSKVSPALTLEEELEKLTAELTAGDGDGEGNG